MPHSSTKLGVLLAIPPVCGEAGDEIGGRKQCVSAEHANARAEFDRASSRRMPPFHALQDHVVARLQRDRCRCGINRLLFSQRRNRRVRPDAERGTAAAAVWGASFPEASHQGMPSFGALTRSVSRGQVDAGRQFAVPPRRGGGAPAGRRYLAATSATVPAERNDAEGAAMIAARSDGWKGAWAGNVLDCERRGDGVCMMSGACSPASIRHAAGSVWLRSPALQPDFR